MVDDFLDSLGHSLPPGQVEVVPQCECDPDRQQPGLRHTVHHGHGLHTEGERLQRQETRNLLSV